MPAIEATDLRKVFPNGVEAVAGIDLAVSAGEIFGFLGPNGAGKTTTTRMLTTLMRPTGGRARVGGFDLETQAREIRSIIGVALQEAGMDLAATGREFLRLQARLFGYKGAAPGARADAMLEVVGLTDAADRRVKTYSGGMKRRLDLASALIHEPSILFLDEPTAGLDPASRRAIWDEVARLARDRGITVFLTTQYLEEADQLAGRVAIIDHGRIVAQGTPAELKASVGSDVITIEVPPEHRPAARATVGTLDSLTELRDDDNGLTLFVSDGSSAVASVVRMLDAARVPVGRVSVAHPTLDEVFLRATGSRLEGASEQPVAEGIPV